MINDANILVVKLGGGEGLDIPRAINDISQIAQERPVVIVHGVSARMNQLCLDLNVPVQTLQSPTGHSSRYTNPETRDVFVRAARDVNATIVEWLNNYGIQARGLVNDADVVIQGERKRALRALVNGRVRIIRDDYSGSITGVDGSLIREMIAEGVVPVLPPMAISADGLLNIDGDRASAAIAAELDAEELVILSNVRGLFSNWPDESSLVENVTGTQLHQAMDWAQGRMKRKVLGAQEALEGGVQRVVIGDGRLSSPVSKALAGTGTVFRA